MKCKEMIYYAWSIKDLQPLLTALGIFSCLIIVDLTMGLGFNVLVWLYRGSA